MEYGMLRRATPEKRFNVIFIAAEVAITIVIGSAFFASIAKSFCETISGSWRRDPRVKEPAHASPLTDVSDRLQGEASSWRPATISPESRAGG